jgi:hypothetical protein
VLPEQTDFRFDLALLSLQKQSAVKPAAEVDVGVHWHQDSLKFLCQIQQPLHLGMSGESTGRFSILVDHLVSVSRQDFDHFSCVHDVLPPGSLAGQS